jgi:peptide deformylase
MRIKIVSVGEPVLRNAARPLGPEEIASERIRELIENMRETLADAPGVGLAAPQIEVRSSSLLVPTIPFPLFKRVSST